MENNSLDQAKPRNITKDNNQCSVITINEFLSFLKTAYQVQDSIEDILSEKGTMNEAVKWLKSKEKEFSNSTKNVSLQTSKVWVANEVVVNDTKDECPSTVSIDSINLKSKLNEILSEGLIDSILPYLMPNNNTNKKSVSYAVVKTIEKPIQHPNVTHQTEKSHRKKSSTILFGKSDINKTESEVEIHVCDEVKNLKKTFVCNQKLLLEKMRYFDYITLGQRVEDVYISVHCDIDIFEWLMQWMKKEEIHQSDWPQLDAHCVIPILVSAAFLQMEPLLNDCLLYCHQHLNEILRTSTNLSCLNDAIITRLAAMYTNTELELIKDRKDRIQSRLFTKLIQSLAEVEAESVRGHWCSLAMIFRCEKCKQLISPNVASKIPCVPSNMRLQTDGSISSMHIRDPTWDLNQYIVEIHKILKNWRKVYWRLWGNAHFLFCLVCKRYFQANHIDWCRYHPDTPQYFTLDTQKAPLPIGRYPCCGERAYRFQLLDNNSGCQFRPHLINCDDVKQSAIYAMLEMFKHLIEEEPPQLLFPERLTRIVAREPKDDSEQSDKFICKETFWWDGLEIIPPRPKMGLLSTLHSKTNECDVESNNETDESDTEDSSEDESESSSSGHSNEESVENIKVPPKKKIPRKTKTNSKFWQHNLSARSNQDIQRAYEESLMKQICSVPNAESSIPCGGHWVRLERELRESLSISHQNDQSLKNKTSNSNKCLKPKNRF